MYENPGALQVAVLASCHESGQSLGVLVVDVEPQFAETLDEDLGADVVAHSGTQNQRSASVVVRQVGVRSVLYQQFHLQTKGHD